MSKTMKSMRRSGVALAALGRNSAGAMKHRLAPRGGSRRLDWNEDDLDLGPDEPMFFDLEAAS